MKTKKNKRKISTSVEFAPGCKVTVYQFNRVEKARATNRANYERIHNDPQLKQSLKRQKRRLNKYKQHQTWGERKAKRIRAVALDRWWFNRRHMLNRYGEAPVRHLTLEEAGLA